MFIGICVRILYNISNNTATNKTNTCIRLSQKNDFFELCNSFHPILCHYFCGSFGFPSKNGLVISDEVKILYTFRPCSTESRLGSSFSKKNRLCSFEIIWHKIGEYAFSNSIKPIFGTV